MAYCTNSEVALEFKNLTYQASGGLSSGTVDSFIAQSDAYIDSRLGLKYSTPITGTNALLLVKTISIWLTAERVKKILMTLTGNNKGEQSSEPKDGYGKAAEARLQMILDDKMKLSDATLARANDGVSSYTYEEGIEPVFESGVDQW